MVLVKPLFYFALGVSAGFTLPFMFLSSLTGGLPGSPGLAGETAGDAAGDEIGLADWIGVCVAAGLFSGAFVSGVQAPKTAVDAKAEINTSLLIFLLNHC